MTDSGPHVTSSDEYLERLLRQEAKWEIVKLRAGGYDCSWVNPITRKVEQVMIPGGFNPHNVRHIAFSDMKESCTVEWAENASLSMPTSLYRALRAEIQAPKDKRIHIEDLETVMRANHYSGPVRLEMKKAWAALLAGKETVLQIARSAGISKESVYKYRDLWLKYNIVIVNGEQLHPHPKIFELTETEA